MPSFAPVNPGVKGGRRGAAGLRPLALWLARIRAGAWLALSLACGSAVLASETAALKERRQAVHGIATPEFTVLIEAPFVVAGDESPATVRKRARDTIRVAVERLQQDFFTQTPTEVIAIWMFKDRASYEAGTRRFFGESPFSPYGYYSARHRALIMNIGTGTGTLVHEIVHPYLRTNFPRCPPWFDEGLASLFEAPAERNGHLVGGINWRLPGLKQVIRNRATLPFAELFALSAAEFYGASEGYNRYYGQARYLCYYLQERGLLVRFYHAFRERVEQDPSGAKTLAEILGEDLVVFQQRWESFVLDLPER